MNLQLNWLFYLIKYLIHAILPILNLVWNILQKSPTWSKICFCAWCRWMPNSFSSRPNSPTRSWVLWCEAVANTLSPVWASLTRLSEKKKRLRLPWYNLFIFWAHYIEQSLVSRSPPIFWRSKKRFKTILAAKRSMESIRLWQLTLNPQICIFQKIARRRQTTIWEIFRRRQGQTDDRRVFRSNEDFVDEFTKPECMSRSIKPARLMCDIYFLFYI